MSRPDVLIWRGVGLLFAVVAGLCFLNAFAIRGYGAPADAGIVCALFAAAAWRAAGWMKRQG